MTGLLVISEERLWTFVLDAWEGGRFAERNEAPMPEDYMHEFWLQSGPRKRIAHWVGLQKKGKVA